jgi:cbb3-type cytochrome oxidase maturation protein
VEILILLIPLGVVIALGVGAAFWWSAENGQFDDLEGPGHRILMDDDQPGPEAAKVDSSQENGGPLKPP